jgi:hypothetical protein
MLCKKASKPKGIYIGFLKYFFTLSAQTYFCPISIANYFHTIFPILLPDFEPNLNISTVNLEVLIMKFN